MDYSILENDIVNRLSVLNSVGVETIVLPESDSGIVKPFDKGKVTVAYNKSSFQPSESTSVICQEETAFLELVIQSRKLRGVTGVYTIMQSITALLLGWKTAHSDKMELSKSGFVRHENSTWTYTMTFSTNSLAIEQPDGAITVMAKHITLDHNGDTIEIQSTQPQN